MAVPSRRFPPAHFKQFLWVGPSEGFATQEQGTRGRSVLSKRYAFINRAAGGRRGGMTGKWKDEPWT